MSGKVKVLYAEIKVRVLVDKDKLPDGPYDDDPFEEPLEELVATIEQLEIEGLSYHEGVKIEIED